MGMEATIQQLPTIIDEKHQQDGSLVVMLILGSCVIATFGLLSNSAAVIIGAMIVAPLMLPIRGLAFGALEGNVALFRKGLMAVVVGTILAIVLAWLLASGVSFAELIGQARLEASLKQALLNRTISNRSNS